MKRAALAVAVDAFPLHAAAWAGVPAVGLWGPSDPDIFGYPWHRNVRVPVPCDDPCFPAKDYDTYLSRCSQESGHCMAKIDIEHVWREVEPLL
jgi:ADP-heptose:LPS heptosyltransferase